MKIYKSSEYEFDDGRKRHIDKQELVYCPLLKNNKFPNNRHDIFKCNSCKLFKNKVKDFKNQWCIACGFDKKINNKL